MDSLLTLRRPIKNVRPPSKVVKYGKCKRLFPAPPARRAKPPVEPESAPDCRDGPGPVLEHVSFVALYHDVCRERNGGLPTSAFLTRWEPRAQGAGDTARAPLAHLVMEIDY